MVLPACCMQWKFKHEPTMNNGRTTYRLSVGRHTKIVESDSEVGHSVEVDLIQ